MRVRNAWVKLAQKVITSAVRAGDENWLRTASGEVWVAMANINDTDMKHIPEAIQMHKQLHCHKKNRGR